MKTIGVEEHAWTAELRDALIKVGSDDTVRLIAEGFPEANELLVDVGDRRLERMDASGIEIQVLSITAPGAQPLKSREAVPLAHDANDFLAAAVSAHPDRFAAFATLPTADPDAATAEFERSVKELGMVGAMLCLRTGDRYLDHETLRPIFEVADSREVVVYVHP